MIRDVYLHGTPGRLFGRRFRLDVRSPAEAVRALLCLRPRIRRWLREGSWRVIVGPPHIRYGIEAASLGMDLGNQPLHLVPATQPHGGDGSGKGIAAIIVGVILIGAAVVATGGLAAAFVATDAAFMGMTWGGVAMLGASMLVSGVAALLMQSPQTASTDATDRAAAADRPSFLFNGVTNNSQPGGPVPLVIGTMLVGSVVVSAGLQSEDIA